MFYKSRIASLGYFIFFLDESAPIRIIIIYIKLQIWLFKLSEYIFFQNLNLGINSVCLPYSNIPDLIDLKQALLQELLEIQ
jgi:hypothetical protein